MKNFNEVFEEIKSSVSVTKNGKIKKTFSRSDFDKLLKAFLNDTGYTTTSASTKLGELVKEDIQPVKEFRDTVITKLLTDAGLEKAEAAKIAAEYEFTKVDGLYEIISEIIYKYCEANKKFDFITKENFAGSVVLNDIEAGVGEYNSIKKNPDGTPVEKYKVETKAHKVMKVKSKAPKWLKKKFK
jgi:hypothetical protein